MAVDVFGYQDYKKYLVDLIKERSSSVKGLKSRLAHAANCQSAYVSQVLGGGSHFSVEQGDAISAYLGHPEDESEFFLLLIQLARAGTPSLKARLQKKIRKMQDDRLSLKNRLKADTVVSVSDMTRYFTHWDHAAVHALLTVPAFLTRQAIAKRLKTSEKRVGEILEFLESTGQARKEGDGYALGQARMHVGTDAQVLPLHHTNWRLQAVRSLNRDLAKDTHYTGVITISDEDVERVKKMWIEFVLQIKEITKKTKPSDLHCLSFDFFRV